MSDAIGKSLSLTRLCGSWSILAGFMQDIQADRDPSTWTAALNLWPKITSEVHSEWLKAKRQKTREFYHKRPVLCTVSRFASRQSTKQQVSLTATQLHEPTSLKVGRIHSRHWAVGDMEQRLWALEELQFGGLGSRITKAEYTRFQG